MSIRPDASDTFIFIPETSPATGAFSGKLTIDGFVLNAVNTDDPGVGSIRITKAGAVTFSATLDDGLLLPAVKTDDDDGAAIPRVAMGGGGTLTLNGNVTYDYGGTVTLASASGTTTYPGTVVMGSDSRIQVLDDGLLLPAVQMAGDVNGDTVTGQVTFGGSITLQNITNLGDGLGNGGDIILTSIGTLGDASSSLADWTIL